MSVASIEPRTCESCGQKRLSAWCHAWDPDRMVCADCALDNVVADLVHAAALVEGVVKFTADELVADGRMTLVLAGGLIDTVLDSLARKAAQC